VRSGATNCSPVKKPDYDTNNVAVESAHFWPNFGPQRDPNCWTLRNAHNHPDCESIRISYCPTLDFSNAVPFRSAYWRANWGTFLKSYADPVVVPDSVPYYVANTITDFKADRNSDFWTQCLPDRLSYSFALRNSYGITIHGTYLWAIVEPDSEAGKPHWLAGGVPYIVAIWNSIVSSNWYADRNADGESVSYTNNVSDGWANGPPIGWTDCLAVVRANDYSNWNPYRSPHSDSVRHADRFTFRAPDWATVVDADAFPYWIPVSWSYFVPFQQADKCANGSAISGSHRFAIIGSHRCAISWSDRLAISWSYRLAISWSNCLAISNPDCHTISNPDCHAIRRPDGVAVRQPHCLAIIHPNDCPVSIANWYAVGNPDSHSINDPDCTADRRADCYTDCNSDFISVKPPYQTSYCAAHWGSNCTTR
jgi:hypothetical protein